jgi:hypothetical protein
MDEPGIPVVYDDAGQQASLEEFVDRTLRHALQVAELQRDADGDIPIPRGSSVTFVRVRGRVDQPSQVIMFSPMLNGVGPSPGLLEALNEINRQLRIGRAFHTGQQVILQCEILADALRAEDLVWALEYMTQAADLFDSQLLAGFGGTTAYRAEGDGPAEG